MPRIVDHEERRRTVARIARTLILKKGIDRVTVREIAGKAGFSTAVVSHYFRDKKDLMLLVFKDTQASAESRFRKAIEAELPLIDTLEALLPRDVDTNDTWRVWFAFWSLTLAHDDFREEQVAQARKTMYLISSVLKHHHVPADSEEERLLQAQRLFAALSGIATQATHDPEWWPVQRQRSLIQAELDSLSASCMPWCQENSARK